MRGSQNVLPLLVLFLILHFLLHQRIHLIHISSQSYEFLLFLHILFLLLVVFFFPLCLNALGFLLHQQFLAGVLLQGAVQFHQFPGHFLRHIDFTAKLFHNASLCFLRKGGVCFRLVNLL